MIDKEEFASLKSGGRVADGMIPKLTNSFKAIDSGVRKVIIKHAKNLLNNKGSTLK
jgi:acetylglutamate kinase